MKQPPASPATARALRSGPGLVIVVQAAVIIALAWALAIFSRDEFHAAEGDQPDEAISAPPLQESGQVSLDARAIEAADIAWAAVETASVGNAAVWPAVVVDLAPLLEARGRALQLAAEQAAAASAARTAEAELQRLRALFADDRNVSERAVQAADAAARRDAARHQALAAQRAALLQGQRQTWGETLARWASGESTGAGLEGLASGREVLVQLAAHPAPERVSLASADGTVRGTAQRLGPAPRLDPGLAGSTAFYRATLPGARAGMRLSGQPLGKAHGQGISGQASPEANQDAASRAVSVPASAVVWYAGRAWVYRLAAEADADASHAKPGAPTGSQSGDEPHPAADAKPAGPATTAPEPAPPAPARHRFERRAIDGQRDAAGVWRTTRLDPGDAVVVRGAQFLLSEELRGEAHDENED